MRFAGAVVALLYLLVLLPLLPLLWLGAALVGTVWALRDLVRGAAAPDPR